MNQVTFVKSPVSIVTNTILERHPGFRPRKIQYELHIVSPTTTDNTYRVSVIVFLDIVKIVSKEHLFQFKTNSEFKFANDYDAEETIRIIHHFINSAIKDFNTELGKIKSTILLNEQGTANIKSHFPNLPQCKSIILKALETSLEPKPDPVSAPAQQQ